MSRTMIDRHPICNTWTPSVHVDLFEAQAYYCIHAWIRMCTRHFLHTVKISFASFVCLARPCRLRSVGPHGGPVRCKMKAARFADVRNHFHRSSSLENPRKPWETLEEKKMFLGNPEKRLIDLLGTIVPSDRAGWRFGLFSELPWHVHPKCAKFCCKSFNVFVHQLCLYALSLALKKGDIAFAVLI